MERLSSLLVPSRFLPHGQCLLWDSTLLWIHAISDAIIVLSYYSIPFVLGYFVYKRRDLAFRWMFLLFGAFIFGCGTTHLLGIWTLWEPVYWLEGVVKLTTAGVSVVTAALLVPLLPKALALPSPAQLERLNRELTAEVDHRRKAESALKLAYEELEQRIQARTRQLAAANQALADKIAEYEHADRALRDSEERFRCAVFYSPVPMMIHKEDEVLLVNQAWTDYTGYQSDDIPTVQAWTHKAHGAAGGADCSYIDHLYDAEHNVDHGEWPVRTKTGESRRWNIYTAPLGASADGRRLVSMVAVDVTERRQAEEQLRLVVESAPNGIVMVDETGRITLINAELERQFGYSRSELLGQSVEVLLPESLRLGHSVSRADFMEAPEARPMGAGRELHGLRKDGTTFPVEVGLTPVRALSEQGILAAVVDITERKQLEERMRHAAKMEALGRLAGGVAHEFNNLLTAILGYSEVLRSRLTPQDPGFGPVEEISRAATRAASLTQQLLAFSRKQVPQIRQIDLNATIMQLSEMLRRLIGEHIRLVTDLDPSLPCVKADPAQIDQIIMNLTVNARDAMPAGGILKIETHAAYEPLPLVHLLVSDTGMGMDEHTLANIFEPFFTTKGPGRGTGLGLSIVYGIVQQYGGVITVDSTVGHGSVFSIELPGLGAAPTALEDGSTGSVQVPVPPGGNETILVVEDEESVRRLLTELLTSHGYAVRTASNGDEALDCCHDPQQGQIDILLTDVVMPGMSGRQLAAKLRAQHAGLKVLYMSGYAKDAMSLDGVEGAEAFIAKPYELDTLLRTIREVLDEGKAQPGERHDNS
jgi:PAS domain S-box-containing protein